MCLLVRINRQTHKHRLKPYPSTAVDLGYNNHRNSYVSFRDFSSVSICTDLFFHSLSPSAVWRSHSLGAAMDKDAKNVQKNKKSSFSDCAGPLNLWAPVRPNTVNTPTNPATDSGSQELGNDTLLVPDVASYVNRCRFAVVALVRRHRAVSNDAHVRRLYSISPPATQFCVLFFVRPRHGPRHQDTSSSTCPPGVYRSASRSNSMWSGPPVVRRVPGGSLRLVLSA